MTSEKAYALEGRVNTQVAEGWSIPFEAVKPSDEGRTASASYTVDSDLQFTAVPAGTYKFDLDISYRGGAGVAEGDLKIDIDAPSGFVLTAAGVARLASDPGATLHQVALTGTAADTPALYTNGLAVIYAALFSGSLITTIAGTVSLRWCTGTNTGTNTFINAGSRMALSRRI